MGGRLSRLNRTAVSGDFAIETFGGAFVDTHRPDPSSISLEDIAHALAQTCRFGGHCQRFYSVAEHAVFVSRRLERQTRDMAVVLAGLHHDDAEAYLGDIPRPMKPLLGDAYEALSDSMDDAIVQGLRLPFASELLHCETVKGADTWALFVEARHLLPSRGQAWNGAAYGWDALGAIVTPSYWRGGISPEEAKTRYLSRHAEIMATVDG